MKKKLDRNGRWRNKIISFRMSPEENVELNKRVRLSGLAKQDYLIKRSLDIEVVVIGNPRVYKALRDEVQCVLKELKRINNNTRIENELIEEIFLIVKIMEGMGRESNPSIDDKRSLMRSPASTRV